MTKEHSPEDYEHIDISDLIREANEFSKWEDQSGDTTINEFDSRRESKGVLRGLASIAVKAHEMEYYQLYYVLNSIIVSIVNGDLENLQMFLDSYLTDLNNRQKSKELYDKMKTMNEELGRLSNLKGKKGDDTENEI